MKDKQKGRSMVEMLGVLAVIAVLAVGVYGIYRMALGRLNVNQTIDLVQKLINDIRIAHSVRTEYYKAGDSSGLNVVDYYISKSIIASNLCAGTWNAASNNCTGGDTRGVLKHPLNGPMNIETVNKKTVISLYDVSRNACGNIVASDWSTGGGTSDVVESITVNTKVYNTYPVPITETVTSCNLVKNNIIFTIRPLRRTAP